MTVAEEFRSPQIIYKPNENIAKPLAIAIIERALRDCVYIRRKDLREFVSNCCVLKSTQRSMLSQQHRQMIKFLNSQFFEVLCGIVEQNDDIMRKKMLTILKDNDAAIEAAKNLGMKFVVPALTMILLIFFPSHAYSQPFAPLRPSIPEPTNTVIPVVEVTTLDSVKAIEIPVRCKGKTNKYRIATYTYLTPDGTKVTYPFLVKGADKAKHPVTAKIKLAGHKLMIFAPFINIAGSLAQIFTAIKL